MSYMCATTAAVCSLITPSALRAERATSAYQSPTAVVGTPLNQTDEGRTSTTSELKYANKTHTRCRADTPRFR